MAYSGKFLQARSIATIERCLVAAYILCSGGKIFFHFIILFTITVHKRDIFVCFNNTLNTSGPWRQA